MSGRPARRTLPALAALLALSLVRAAAAQEPAEHPKELEADVTPILSAAGTFGAGYNEFVVRLQNRGREPKRGRIEIASSAAFGDRYSFQAEAPYAVGAGSSIAVRLPVQTLSHAEVIARVLDEAGAELEARRLSPTVLQPSVLLVDVDEPSHLRGALNEAAIFPSFAAAPGPGGAGPLLTLGSPRFDPATGDPILPERAAAYGSAAAVLVHTDRLGRLSGTELDALAGWVLGGGTLALVVARPEDLRQPAVAAFAGGELTRTAVRSETLKELVLPTPSPGSSGGRAIASAAAPGEETGKDLAGYVGGNLRGSVYGTSAPYGLGEVHLLAFDPTKKPAVDDPWVLSRMVDLARRAHDRRSTVIFPMGAPLVDAHELAPVRKLLDPNEGSRWAIGVAAILLCLYALVAGPITFSVASRRGRPLAALGWMLAFSAATFGVIVGIGVATKGVFGRARHLTLVEAGGGMTKGVARRWRGFFASRTKELTVRTSDPVSALSSAATNTADDARDRLLVDRDGARLVDVSALPWQVVVVREDGPAELGEGIALVHTDADDVAVINRSGRDLRAAILKLPGGEAKYFPRIKDGERAAASAARTLGSTRDERRWVASIAAGRRAGRLDVHPLAGGDLRPILEGDAPGLGEAWAALEQTAGPSVDWLPDAVPVLVGQLDGGEGKRADAGLRLESDRLLVRVVGYGGRP